jgi:Rieske Fe-S protein
MASPPSKNKRRVLSVVLKLLILTGIVIFSIPFIASLYKSDPNAAGQDRGHYLAHNVSHLSRGELIKIKSFSSEVWVYHRTLDDIEQIKVMPAELFRDPLSRQSQQPSDLLPAFRSHNKNYFVFIPFETQKQCQVQLEQMPSGHNGFNEVCYRGVFDTAGRALKSHGHPMQHNLSVPAHIWQDENTLLLDRR